MSHPAYLNFDIQIIARLDGTFRARIAAMPLVMTDVEPDSIFTLSSNTQNLIERFLSETTTTSPSRIRETLARQLGVTLFHTLFNGPILEAYQESRPIAHAKSRYGLRIRLNLEHAPQLSTVPWELMHDTHDFIALSSKTSLIRYPRQIIARRQQTLSLPLCVLLILSGSNGFTSIDRQQRLFETATNPLRHAGQIMTDVLSNPTPSDLYRRLKSNQYHALHFIGYTQADPETHSGYLVLAASDNDATTALIRVDALARQVTEENAVRLVFLDAVQTPASASIVAANFITRGLPALITLQFPISPSALTHLIGETYRTLAEYYPIDEAITRARRAIHARNSVDWASPVLYTHSPNAYLFSRPTSKMSRYISQEVPLRFWYAAAGILCTLVLLLLLVALIGTDDILADDEDDQTRPALVFDADLRINSITLNPNSPIAGQDTTFHLQIENVGTEPSPVTTYELRLTHSIASTIRFRDEIPAIAPDQTLEIEITVPIEESGVYLAQFILDSDNRLSEANEHNNIQSIPFVVP